MIAAFGHDSGVTVGILPEEAAADIILTPSQRVI